MVLCPALPCVPLSSLPGRLCCSGQGDLVPSVHPSGVSKVTASGSRRSRRTARMEAGAPGPRLGHVLGHVGVE